MRKRLTERERHGIIRMIGGNMKRENIFFDLDGTLTDSMPGITRAVQYALKHYGIEVENLNVT